MAVTPAWVAAEARRLRDQLEADSLAAELGCEVTVKPRIAGRVDAWNALPGLRLVSGTPDEVRDAVRQHGLREWLGVLGKQGASAKQARPVLTPRELEVATLVADGLTDQQVARRLSVSLRTVHAHLRNSYAKTGTGNRTGLANWLREQPRPAGT